MVNSIIDGISVRLNEAFGDEYEIYSENVKQGLKEPCFFIEHIITTNSPYLGSRAKRVYTFDIHYFGLDRADLCATGEKMIDEMEYITLLNGDMLRGLNISAEVIDDVLHFHIDYQMMLKKVVEKEPMEKLKLTQTVGEKDGKGH